MNRREVGTTRSIRRAKAKKKKKEENYMEKWKERINNAICIVTSQIR